MSAISDTDFLALCQYMKDRYGIDLEKKKAMVEGRLSTVFRQRGFDSVDEYVRFVTKDRSGAEAGTLLTRLTTNYTYFMREDAHYTFLVEKALPELVPTIKDNDLRIWSAASSSGEEPYTIAMVLDDYFGSKKKAWDSTVLATDISPYVLQQAKDAVYSARSIERLSPAYVKKYFVKLSDAEYQVSPAIRKEVVFRSFNLMEPLIPFKKKFHIIFCRNVMIYFDSPTKHALMRRLYDALVPGGYFFIGMSENINRGETDFVNVKPSIYIKEAK